LYCWLNDSKSRLEGATFQPEQRQLYLTKGIAFYEGLNSPFHKFNKDRKHGDKIQSSPPLHCSFLRLLRSNPHHSSPEIHPLNLPYHQFLQIRTIISLLPRHQPQRQRSLTHSRDIFKPEIHNYAIPGHPRLPLKSFPTSSAVTWN